MARFLGEDEVRRVKESVDLVALMGDYAPLQKAGRNFRCCCPFHQERTPSCYVYVDQQTYHCFGCGAHGDALTLVREKEGLDFVDAAEFIARRGGISLRFEERGRPGMQRGVRERLLAAMTHARDFFCQRLWSAPDAAEARAYLEGRGIGRDAWRAFGLGWAPGRGALVESARRAGIAPADLLSLDLAVDRDGRFADRFYERVTFPIADRFGQVLAFSCRILPAAEQAAKAAGRGVGKYINSTDTPLYAKRQVVWNLHRARGPAREAGRIVVMEGPTDAIAAAAAGIHECVAVLGTALTPEHARQLATAVGGDGRVILFFDGDQAGRNNSIKAVGTCLGCGVATRVALAAAGQDPAELVAEGGREALEAALDGNVADVDHLLRTLAPAPAGLEPRERFRVVDQVLDMLRPVTDRDLRRAWIGDLGTWFGLETADLERRLAGDPVAKVADADAADDVALPPLDPHRELALHLLVRHPELRARASDDWGLDPSDFVPPWRWLVEQIGLQPDGTLDDLFDDERLRADDEVRSACWHWQRRAQGRGGRVLDQPAELLRHALARLEHDRLERQRQELSHRIRELQKLGDHAAIGPLMHELVDLQQRRNRLDEDT